MLELIDQGLESFLRATIPLGATDVDVAFEAPDREWSAKLTRPTVNVFLWDIRRSASRSTSGMRTVTIDGQRVHQPAFPVLELRYVLSAWTSDHGDERGLLAGVMRAILAYESIPREFLPADMTQLEVPTLTIARAGEDHMDVFKALEGQLKPGINMVLTTQFDAGTAIPAGPPVTSIETSIGRFNGPRDNRRRIAGDVADAANRGAIGAVVRSPSDTAYINNHGQFLLRAAPGDDIVVETDPQLVTTVPEAGGVRFE